MKTRSESVASQINGQAEAEAEVSDEEAAQMVDTESIAAALTIELPQSMTLDATEDLIEEYIGLLTDDRKTELEERYLNLENESGHELTESTAGLYRVLHSMKGSSGFIGAVLSSKVLHVMEECLSAVQANTDILDAHDIQTLIDQSMKGLDILWELRDCIAGESDESRFAQEHGERTVELIRNLTAFVIHIDRKVANKMENANLDDMF